MKYAALVGLLLWLTTNAVGQTATPQCSLTRERSPEIRGVRLGMTTDKLATIFPEDENRASIEKAVKESKRVDKYGDVRFTLQPNKEAVNPKFSGVNWISIEILDEHIASFQVSYVGPEWNNVDEFISKVADAFHLPTASTWAPANEYQKSLKCDGFVVSAFVTKGSSNPIVSVGDTSTARVVSDRREAAKEKERQAFKP
jgi:hypothetical protein